MLHETRNDPEKLRNYEVPVEALRVGMNFLIVTITDDKGPGGLLGPENELYLEVDDETIPIMGEWKYYVQEKKSRGINYSEFTDSGELAAKFVAFNSGNEKEQKLSEMDATDRDLIRIQLKAVRNEMKYDQTELVVPAGKPVEIMFENVDLMQHNLLIIAPGSLEVVGIAADALAQLPEGQEKQYVPDVPQVLYASALINPGASTVLQFTAPQEPGEYPFVCTFPGHWRTMNGILKVEGAAN
jgi:azurin